MDPVSLQASGLNALRPSIALSNDLSAVLREGRVLAGEVLQSFGGGSLLIGIGSHRVPAQAQVELRPGERFLFQVEGRDAQTVLRVLDEGEGGEPNLLRALRAVLGFDGPLGAVLDELTSNLERLAGSAALVRALAGARWTPGSAPADLAAALASSGGSLEARLGLSAALALPPREAAALSGELASWIAAALAAAPGDGPAITPAALLERLASELARVLGAGLEPSAREAAFSRWLAALHAPGGERAALDLQQLLGAALSGLDDARLRARLLAGLARLRLVRLGPGLEALALRGLLELGAPSRGLRESETRRFADAATGDLKGSLLGAAAEAGQGEARVALERALAAVEAEQLLNVARRGAGEALQWSLPIADGARTGTLRLSIDAPADPCAGREPSWRVGFALDLSGTGPLRADLVARAGTLLVALTVEREATQALLAGELDGLRAALGARSRNVSLSLRRVAPGSLPPADRLDEVAYLREHHVMDLSA